jgi:hypothetical protein
MRICAVGVPLFHVQRWTKGRTDGRTDGLLAMTRIVQDFRTGFAKTPGMNQTFVSEYTTSKKVVGLKV